MSKVDVIMPQMGESIAEGTLTRWLKSVGDPVERDEDLFEISTDKVDADIPAPAAGVLAEILVDEGETVEVNTVVARIDTEAEAGGGGEQGGAGEESDAGEAEPGEAAAQTRAPAAAGEAGADEGGARERPAARAGGAEETAPRENGAGVATREERLRTRSTPLVRKIAAEHDVDIGQVEGTGIAGRVTRDDILAFIETRGEEARAAPAAQPAQAAAKQARKQAAASEAPAPGTMRVPIHGASLDIRIPDVPIREGDRVEEMNRVRLRTMEHMLMSKRISAHVTSVTEIDFERVVKLRRKLKPRFEERGVKLTYGPFIMKAVVEALRDYPILNASVDGTRIVYHRNINLGIAVAINDGKELIVPVLKDADRLSLMGLAQGANELAEKARDKELDFDDIQGGTFTITNVGVFGNLFGTPIINQPQVAILGTGVIEKRPVVVQDDMGNDTIAIRHMAYFGLSYDHRVVDGAMAAFWLNKVQEVIENFPEETV
ncbi:MAG: dihydrolipoamide acetyltransferase family protein [Candidatus Palauibacterales bacterium]|nr:dihydrolipoamide acetyltransferase family protein [Candidatus Palauibacterales bacterium]MDP2531006.1 dihydrolipoamide acetyltransferase family protein [Candidatus Palauibacterales bacterium]MDP2583449.1 dihydrolipoamide acetyltransferase family protein [Candidatus Palauibacterales bacterium]